MLKFLTRAIPLTVLVLCVAAQAQVPAELIQKFQSLPPDAQQVIIGQMQQAAGGGQVQASGGTSNAQSATIQGTPLSEPGAQRQATPAMSATGAYSAPAQAQGYPLVGTYPAAASTVPASPAALGTMSTQTTPNAAPQTTTATTAPTMAPPPSPDSGNGIGLPAPAAASGALMLFGYDLFNSAPTTFAPAVDMPVQKDYLLGPGDTIEIQLFGKANASYALTVQRDGSIQLPDLGPIQVNGMEFENMRQMLTDQIAKRMIGVQSAITMGPLRSIRVFLLGDVLHPGAYDVSALSTMTNALFVGGGVAPTGSLRHIHLKRQGRIVTQLDLYDLLLRGDTSRDARLQPGDVIFIPAIGPTASISGGVRRPAVYEMNGVTSAAELVAMAGGLLSTAYPGAAKIDRVDDSSAKGVIDIDLTTKGRKVQMHDGDLLEVPSVLDRIENSVFVRGHVERPGGFKWSEGLSVSDVLPGPEAMKPVPDLDFGLIARESAADRTVSVVAFSPREAFAGKHGAADLALQPRDTLYTFGLAGNRSDEFNELLSTLRLQARKTDLEEIVSAAGAVQAPGAYPRFKGMRVSDLLRAALNLTPDADRDYSLVVRENRTRHEIYVLTVDLDAVRAGNAEADFALEPRDQLLVFNARASRDVLLTPFLERLRAQARLSEPAKVVKVTGEVRFPGEYPLAGSMTANDLIGIAGGLSEPAYALSAEVSRATADQKTGYQVEPMAVDLSSLLEGVPGFSLQPNDTLQIRRLPKFIPPEVVVLEGEFRFPGEYRIKDGETLRDLIQRAGGLTESADPSNTLFTRESLKAAEAEQLRVQRQQLERDIARLQLEAGAEAAASGKDVPSEALAFSQELAAKLSVTEPVGRMVVNLTKALKGDKDFDLRLLGGDTLRVGKHPQAVSVFGEVLFPTSHQYQSGLSVTDYIRRSGGITQDADGGRTYIVRANGEIVASARGWTWDKDVKPGDTIIVPLDTHPIDPMKLTTNIAQILSSLAITAAAMNAVGAF